MILKTLKVERDQDNNIVSESPIDTLYITPNPKIDKTEAIVYDSVEVTGIIWSKEKGIIQAEINLVGYDSSKTAKAHLGYKTILLTWTRKYEKAFWDYYKLENPTAITIDEIKTWIHEGNNIGQIVRQAWDIPKLESKLLDDSGEIISDYKKQPKQAIPEPPHP